MKTRIEIWIEEQKFTIQIQKLFEESIICYKHGAYRASLLFSYLGFITHIKEVLVKSNNPNSVNIGRWNNIQNEIQDDDKWEKRVFEELTNSSNPIFDIKEDLRQQIKYWKDRRNDCAHFKSNDIENHTIETFWSFLRSNLAKITVEGGKASLINKFNTHFDLTKTPPNTNFDHLILEIHSAVDLVDFDSFLDDLGNEIDRYGFYDDKIVHIHNKILEFCSADYKLKLVSYLKTNKLDIDFIGSYVDKINALDYSESDIRQLWKKRIFKANNRRYVFIVYAALLRNGMIPQNQLKEAFLQLFDKYEQTGYSMPSDIQTKSMLTNQILGEIIFKQAIEEDDLSTFMWVNSKCDFISFYIENFPLKKETVMSLCKMPTRSNYSYWLEEKLKNMFSDNQHKKTEFNNIATQNGLSIPIKFQ